AQGLAAAGARVAELVGGALDVGAGDRKAAGHAGATVAGLAGRTGLAGAGIGDGHAGGPALRPRLAHGRRAGVGLAGPAQAGLAGRTAATAGTDRPRAARA